MSAPVSTGSTDASGGATNESEGAGPKSDGRLQETERIQAGPGPGRGPFGGGMVGQKASQFKPSARRLIGQVNSAERNRIITAAANWAMTQPAATQKYAVIGYCWGGSTTFMHAVDGGVKGFSGGVAFYGAPYTSGGRAATATEPAVPAQCHPASHRHQASHCHRGA